MYQGIVLKSGRTKNLDLACHVTAADYRWDVGVCLVAYHDRDSDILILVDHLPG